MNKKSKITAALFFILLSVLSVVAQSDVRWRIVNSSLDHKINLLTYTDSNPVKSISNPISVVLPETEILMKQTQLTLELPGGKIYYAARQTEDFFGMQAGKNNIWSGELHIFPFDTAIGNTLREDEKAGQIVLTNSGGYITGAVYTDEISYDIYFSKGSYFIKAFKKSSNDICLIEYNEPSESSLSNSEVDINQRHHRNELISAQSQSVPDSGDRIDVLVLYTASVYNELGGSSQVESFIESAVASTNLVLANSLTRTRVNIVGTSQINYAESGDLNADLTWLKTSSSVSQIRNNVAADIVVTLVNNGNACGTSQLLTISGVNSFSGFSVVKRTCAVAGTAFAHEILHNFGADHDPTDTPVPASMHVQPYAFGYSVNGQFVTFMGTFSNAVCPDYCRRIMTLSNPRVLYNGVPTGIENQRDNAKVINRLADTIANIRTSQKSIMLNYPNQSIIWRKNLPRIVTWSSSGLNGNVRIEISRNGGRSFETLINSTPNDGAEEVIITGIGTRQARIRIVSLENPDVTDTSLEDFQIV